MIYLFNEWQRPSIAIPTESERNGEVVLDHTLHLVDDDILRRVQQTQTQLQQKHNVARYVIQHIGLPYYELVTRALFFVF